MKRFSIFAFAATVALVSAQSNLLRRTLEVGEEKFDVTTNITSTFETPAGNQENTVKSTMEYVVKILKSENGVAEAEFITQNIKAEVDGDFVDANSLSTETKATGKLNTRNQVTDYKMAPVAGSGLTSMFTDSFKTPAYFMADLPEGEVKVGDTWEVVLPGSREGIETKDTKFKSTLTEMSEDGYTIKVEGPVEIVMDTTKLPEGVEKPPFDLIMKSNGDIKHTIKLAKDGRVKECTTESNMKLSIEVMGQSIPGNMSIKSVAKRKS